MSTVTSSPNERRVITQPDEEKLIVVIESQHFQTTTTEQEEKDNDKNQPLPAENVTFSLNQVVQMRTDALTRRKIHKYFGHHHSKKVYLIKNSITY